MSKLVVFVLFIFIIWLKVTEFESYDEKMNLGHRFFIIWYSTIYLLLFNYLSFFVALTINLAVYNVYIGTPEYKYWV